MDIRSSYWHNDFYCFADIAMQSAKVQQIRRDDNAWWGLHQLTNAYLSSLNSAAVCHRSSFRQHMQVVYSVSMGSKPLPPWGWNWSPVGDGHP